MLGSQSNDVLLHIFSFVPPEFLCTSCMYVNSRWHNLINTTSLWTSWYNHFPFLLYQPPRSTSNLRDTMKAVLHNNKWKIGKFNNRHYFEAHRGTLLINMSLHGDLLATTTSDRLVKVWNISSPIEDVGEKDKWILHSDSPTKVYGGHVATPKALQIGSDILISGGIDKINIWNIHNDRLLGILHEASQCRDLCFSSNTLVNTSGGTLQVWDLNCMELVNILEPITSEEVIPGELREVKMNENISVAIDKHHVYTWDMRTGSSTTIQTEVGIMDCLEYDGKNTVIYNTADEVKFIDIRTGQQAQRIDVDNNLVCTLFLEGNKLILGEDPVQIRAFDIRDVSQPLFSLKTSRTPVKVRSYQHYLVSGARAWGINVWNFL